MRTIETTYDIEIARKALDELGKSARSFQKSGCDGKPDLYTIYRIDGRVVDVTRDFTPIF